MKKKIKIRYFNLFVPIYQYDIYFRLGGTQDEALAWASKKLNTKTPITAEGDMGACVMTIVQYPDHCIWFRDIDPNASTIAHEVFHSVVHVFKHKNIWPLSESNEEAYAYLIGSLMGQIVLQLKKK